MFTNKNILVCGMAKSGQAVAKLLHELGAHITVQDKKTDITWTCDPSDFNQYLGRDPDGIVGNFDIIIISPGISVYAPFVQKAESLGVTVWGEAELAYRLCPCPMVAITGTNGKTTVTTLVGEILKQHNPGTVVGGNIGTPLTELVTKLSPGNIVVAEISSFQLETIAAFKPAVSAVLNITPDHLDRHKTMEVYISMKARIFENQSPDDVCVLNYDNPITKKMHPPGRVVYFSTTEILQDGVYLKNGNVCATFSRNPVLIAHSQYWNDGEVQILPISETRVMPENALAATALALCAGASPAQIAHVLKTFPGVPHRMEYVAELDGVEYYNDSKATNIDSAIKAIESTNRPIVLIAGGSDKDLDFTPWVKTFPGKVSHLIVIGETTQKIVDTCNNLGFNCYKCVKTLQEATDLARKISKPGDRVILSPACASFDMFKNYEERGDIFKSCVRNL